MPANGGGSSLAHPAWVVRDDARASRAARRRAPAGDARPRPSDARALAPRRTPPRCIFGPWSSDRARLSIRGRGEPRARDRLPPGATSGGGDYSPRCPAGSWRSCWRAIMFGATIVGLLAGRSLVSHRKETLREPFGWFRARCSASSGCCSPSASSLAVSRYESRRADVVSEANAIGTTNLRAQTLAEPVAAARCRLSPTRTRAALSDHVPGSDAARAAAGREARIQRGSGAWPGRRSRRPRERAAALRGGAERDDRRRPCASRPSPTASRRPSSSWRCSAPRRPRAARRLSRDPRRAASSRCCSPRPW